MPETERLVDIIGQMVHGGVNARRTLSRGLIITYMTPEPDMARERARWSLTAARLNLWPDDKELQIVFGCLRSAWSRHPRMLVYDASDWTKREVQTRQGVLGSFVIYWREWPVREVFSAPAHLQETLRSALARR
jgi:hypothetical protein